MIDQAIQMVLLPGCIYHKMQEVFRLFEEGKLKGQKPRVMKGVTLKKALEGKLAPKLPQFKVFQGLDVSWSGYLFSSCTHPQYCQDADKQQVLDDLLDRSISFVEAEGRSMELKAVASAKVALLAEVELDNWEEAKTTIPEFTNEGILSNFKLQRGKPLPQSFKVITF